MADEKRFLKESSSYYEYAQQQSATNGFFNQSTLYNDFHLHIFWCRYIHYNTNQRYRANTKLHSHSFFELHCILSGTMVFHEPNGQPREISAGQFVLIAPQTKHFLQKQTPEAETFALTFEPICADNEQGSRTQLRFDSISALVSSLDAEASAVIELIMQELHDNQLFCTQNVKALLNILIADLIRSVFEISQPAPVLAPLCNARLINLEKYIEDNGNRFFTVSELSEYLNISTRQLNNIINEELGMSAKVFLDMKKTAQARRLLLETDLTLHEISEQIGFSEPNNFNRFFKRIEGMSPGIFRLSKGNYKDNQYGTVK